MTTKITFEQMLKDEQSLVSDIEKIGREISESSDPARQTPLLVELKEAIADLETLRHEILNFIIASSTPELLGKIMYHLNHD